MSASNDPSLTNTSNNNPKDSFLVFYFTYYVFLIGFTMEWSIISILYRKNYISTLQKHQSFMSLIVISFIVVTTISLVREVYYIQSSFYKSLDITMIVLGAIQLILGITTSTLLSSTNISSLIGIRWTHRINGGLFYFFSKIKLFLIVFGYMQDTPRWAFGFLTTTYFILLIISHVICYVFYYTRSRRENTILGNSKWLHEEVIDVIQSIEHLDFYSYDNEDANKTQELDEKDNSVPSTIFNEILWCVYEDKVFNLNQLHIPCGRFIRNLCKRKDITKLLKGQDILIYNYKEKIHYYRHKHGFRTKNVLNSHCLAKLRREKPFEPCQTRDFYNEGKGDEINLLSPAANDFISRSLRIETKIENFTYFVAFNRSVQNNLVFLLVCSNAAEGDKNSSHYTLDTHWLKTAGCYALMFNQNEEVPYFDVLRSFNPKYIRQRIKLLSQFSPNFFQDENCLRTDLIRQLIDVPDEYSRSPNTHFYPMIGFNPKSNFINNTFLLDSDCGFPLPIQHNSYLDYLVFVKNEGVFRILDFIEVLIQRYLASMDQSHLDWQLPYSTQHSIFPNGVSITLLFSISEDFLNTAKTFGLYQLYLLSTLGSLATKIRPILNRTIIICSSSESIHSCFSRCFSLEQALDNLIDVKVFDKIILSGSPEFKIEVIKNPKFEFLNVNKFILI